MFAEDYKSFREKYYCSEDSDIRDRLYKWTSYGAGNFQGTVFFYGKGEECKFNCNVFNVFMDSFYDYHRYEISHNADIKMSDFVKARYDVKIEPYEGSFDTIRFTRKKS
jgi:hypothetical protein